MLLKEHYRKGIGIPGSFLILYWWTHSSVVLAIGISLTVLWLIPFTGRLVLPLWLKFSHTLGYWNSKILLSLIFFLILTPIAGLKKLVSSRHNKNTWKTKTTGFHFRNHSYTASDLKNLW